MDFSAHVWNSEMTTCLKKEQMSLSEMFWNKNPD